MTPINQNSEAYYTHAVGVLEQALSKLYAEPPSLQQLSATFRRGDLIEVLNKMGE